MRMPKRKNVLYQLSQLSSRERRAGVTILEVLFAMGVVIVGLMGIFKLLAVAGNQATESTRASEAQNDAHLWYSEMIARDLHKRRNWVFYQDISATGFTPGYSYYMNPANPGTFRLSTTKSPTTARQRALEKQPVCIDPMFFADVDIRAATTTPPTPLQFLQTSPPVSSDQWYRPAVFPYFKDQFNPLTDPAYTIGATGSIAWNEQPRMVRVTFTEDGSTPVQVKFVEQVFASQDDLAITLDIGDASIAPVRTATFYETPSATATQLPIARSAAQTKYSWIATLSPNETFNLDPVDFGTLSLVVIHNRDRMFFNPRTSTPLQRTGEPTPEDKPQGERLVWVVPLSGNFNGGTGGRVRLICSDGVNDKVRIGDWIMLGKYASVNTTHAHPVFRWYRIAACDQVEYADSTSDYAASLLSGLSSDPFGNDPPSTDNVWFRDVVLDGPDWDFSLNASSGFPTPTTGTIVTGAVTVIERIVELN